MFDLNKFQDFLNPEAVKKVSVFEQIDSTNEFLKNQSETIDGWLAVAETQTAGKGRRGRKWIDNPGENLLFSIGYIPKNETNISVIPLLGSLSVHRILKRVIGECSIKWPNDVLAGNKKISGLLLESKYLGDEIRVVIGIGLNVNQSRFDGEISDTATSILLETDKLQSREKILSDIVNELKDILNRFESGDSAGLIEEYTICCSTIGAEISFLHNGIQLTGVAKRILPDGSLMIESGAEQIAYHGNEISHIRKVT